MTITYLQSRHSINPDPRLPYPSGCFGRAIAYDSELYGQVEAWLILLLIYHPAKEAQEHIDFKNEVKLLD